MPNADDLFAIIKEIVVPPLETGLETQLNELVTAPVKHYAITCSHSPSTTLPDGTKIVLNENGKVIFAHYQDGSKVMRHAFHVMCSNKHSENWFRDVNNRWYRLD